jgi:hypothetical protein
MLIRRLSIQYKEGLHDGQRLLSAGLHNWLSCILDGCSRFLDYCLSDYNRTFGRVWSSWTLVNVIEAEYVFRLEFVIKQDVICKGDK